MTESRRAFESMVTMLPEGKFNKQELIANTAIFWDFQDFIMTKFNMTEKESENKFRSYVMDKLKDAKPEELADPNVYIEHLGKYAEESGFTDHSALKDGFRYMTSISLSVNVDENNSQ